MLRQLHIQHYKSIRQAYLDNWGPVRVLIGPNASGKSNVIDALRFVHDVVVQNVEDAVSKRRGGMSKILFQGAEPAGPSFTIGIKYSSKIRSRVELQYVLDVGERRHRPILSGERLFRKASGGQTPIFISEEGQSRLGKARFDTGEMGETALKVLRSMKGNPAIRELAISIGHWLFLDIQTHRIRRPQREVREDRLEPDAGNLVNVLFTLSKENPVTLQAILNDVGTLVAQVRDFHFQVERGQVLLLVEERALSRPIDPESLSDGTLRILALVTALHTMPEHGLLCVEEPEHGLHPLLFGPLMAFFRERCPEGGTRQLILTTHSSELVDAAHPDEIVPVERNENGATVFPVLDRKKLNEWLKDFRLGELWKMRQLGAVP